MSATASTVKRLPHATFSFRGRDVGIELTADNHYAVICPVCGAFCQIPDGYDVIIHNRRVSTIYPSLGCPANGCGLRIVVVRGRAFEVEPLRPPAEPPRALEQGQTRCEECGRGFNAGFMAQKVCQRCAKRESGLPTAQLAAGYFTTDHAKDTAHLAGRFKKKGGK